MGGWRTPLRIDPITALLAVDDTAQGYFVRRNLLGQDMTPPETLWRLPEGARLVRKQLPNRWAIR